MYSTRNYTLRGRETPAQNMRHDDKPRVCARKLLLLLLLLPLLLLLLLLLLRVTYLKYSARVIPV